MAVKHRQLGITDYHKLGKIIKLANKRFSLLLSLSLIPCVRQDIIQLLLSLFLELCVREAL